MRHLAAVLALLLVPAAAGAKEIVKVSVCGPDRCVHVTRQHFSNEQLHSLVEVSGDAGPLAAAAPWYRVRVSGRGDGERSGWSQAWVPGAGRFRGRTENGEPQWMAALPAGQRLLEKVSADLRAYPAARLTGLDVKPPAAQVSEVVLPPRPVTGDGFPWTWPAVALAAAGALVLVLRRVSGRAPAGAR